MNTMTTRPAWKELNHRQRLAAFAKNQDNFEQSGLSMAAEWNEYLDCFDDAAWAENWADLNRQANAYEVNTPEWKQDMGDMLKCANRKR